MKLITKDTSYAILALCFIAGQKDKIVSVNEIVRCLKVPCSFCRKILQLLNKKGLLKSYRGLGGGFKLAVDPRKLTLKKLVEIFQGPLKLTEHTFQGKRCPKINTCLLKQRLDVIEQCMTDELQSVTIASLL